MSKALPCHMGMIFVASRGRIAANGFCAFGMAAWPTDPIGTTTVTFDGVHAGSEIRVCLSDGTEIAGVEDCLADHVLSWSVYTYGNPNNVVRVVINHLDYGIKEFFYTSKAGAQSIPVQQDLDIFFNNP